MSSFVDKVIITVKAGDGGNGALSFRHEKFIDKGGPDGGDGGDGGDVIARASRNQNTLASFRYQKELKAEPGAAGFKQRKHGKSGKDLVVDLPIGTVVSDATTGQVIADLTIDGQQAIIAHGGKGGFGNAHFISSTRQAPRIVERGEPGEQLSLTLELKMIADVGLVGLPNAGKSTLLSVISNARPQIADYPFTTLTPNLGVVDVDKKHSLLFADIPGLIAGAAEGKGLGDEFLRHVERTGVLVHLIDIYYEDVVSAYKTIQKELEAYKVNLTKRPQIVVLTKTEGLTKDIIADTTKKLKPVVPNKTPIIAISSQAKTNIKELIGSIDKIVKKQQAETQAIKEAQPDIPVIRLDNEDNGWQVTKTDNGYQVTGTKIERFAIRTDFNNEASVGRLKDVMRRNGILHELSRLGATAGDTIIINQDSFIL